ncbi:hypothetical protein FF124_13105 [Martelella lutilitoris]|uniref:Type I restriction modification DNA specificity domain-containing protein n=1 Tax=Martelella lutilitoris TaxID=2583532 RepID=A0A5C4JNU5_9HYPH|nr:restriction endonuclease subunit S [Martelella lutilitoris]TNB47115.1 hypothetical protein FF124_13105 [Martelella lutilitoris]
MTNTEDLVADEWTPVTPKVADHWAIANFDEFFETVASTGKKVPAKNYLKSGTWPVIDQGADFIGGFTDDETTLIRSPKPVLVFGDHTRCMKFVKGAFAPGADGTKLLLTKDGIEPRYAYHLYFAIRLPNRGYSRHFGFLKRCKFPVPPMNEQRRIVERIEAMFDEIDHGVENLKKARASLGLYRQSLLKSAFEGRLTADWRARNADKLESPETLLARIRSERDARYKAALDDWQNALSDWREHGEKGKRPAKPRRQAEAFMDKEWLEKLPELPGSTSWVACNQLSGQISDGTHKTPTYTDTGIHFISAKDIRDFKVDFSSTRFVDKTQHVEMSKRCNVEMGNVLLTKSGAIGRVAVVDTATSFSLFESVANIPVLPPMQSRFVAYAVYHIANSYFISHAEKGVAVRHLHLEDIRKMPLPLYGVEEQAEITRILDDRLSAADALEAEIDAGLNRADVLRQSILKQAFSGKLVPQDPNDEPAADLLARIKAEKITRAKVTRKTKAIA